MRRSFLKILLFLLLILDMESAWATTDLSGIWQAGPTEIIITQTGNRLSGRLSQLPEEGKKHYRIGEPVLEGELQGNILTGRIMVRPSAKTRENCPQYEDIWIPVQLTLAPTGRGFVGQVQAPLFSYKKYKDGRIECSMENRVVPMIFTRQVTPHKPELRFLVQSGKDYIPMTDSIEFNKPFIIEARFKEKLDQDTFTVTLDTGAGQQGITVYSLRNSPEVYRSKPVVLKQQSKGGKGQ